MKKMLAVVFTMVLLAAICLGKDAEVAAPPTTPIPTKADTLAQTEPVFGLDEKHLDRGNFKSFKSKVPALFDATLGPSCGGCGGPHDCCAAGLCVKQCK